MLIKLSAKSYSFDILCTVDVFGALLRLGNGCASRGKVFLTSNASLLRGVKLGKRLVCLD